MICSCLGGTLLGPLVSQVGDHVGMESKVGLAVFSVLCYLHVSHAIVSCQHSGVRRDALWEGCTSGYVIPVWFQAIPVSVLMVLYCSDTRVPRTQACIGWVRQPWNDSCTRGPRPHLHCPSHRATGAYQRIRTVGGSLALVSTYLRTAPRCVRACCQHSRIINFLSLLVLILCNRIRGLMQ